MTKTLAGRQKDAADGVDWKGWRGGEGGGKVGGARGFLSGCSALTRESVKLTRTFSVGVNLSSTRREV